MALDKFIDHVFKDIKRISLISGKFKNYQSSKEEALD